MELSPSQSKNDFDVLASQEDASKKPTRFEDIPKPTELPPLPRIEKTEAKPAPADSPTPAEPEFREKFIVPRLLLEYIHELVKSGRKLKVLEFDISEAVSETQIKNILDAKLESGLVSGEEKKEMLGLLTDLKTETEMQDIKIEKSAAEIKKDESINLIVEELDEHPVRSRRKKVQNLKINHGIVMENIGEMHTPLEQSIIDKSTKLWKGTEREGELSLALMTDGPLQFHKEPEVPLTKSFDGVVKKQIKMPEKISNGQDMSRSPLDMGNIGNINSGEDMSKPVFDTFDTGNTGKVEKMMEAPDVTIEKSQPSILMEDFGGKPIQVVKDGTNITISFGGKEIAEGVITADGHKIRLHKEFKAGFLFAKTDEEKAFERALTLIKSFKN